MKKSTWWIIGIVVVVVIAIVISSKSKSAESGPIKIGFIGPLTGDAATFGEPISNGTKLAEKQINDAGGINGRKIQVIYEDGKCDGQAAVSAVQKLINVDKVKFIAAGVCSSEVLAIASIVDKAKVLVISPGATSPKISGVSQYVFRNAPSDAGRGVAIANRLALTFKKPAIVSENTDYAKGLHDTYVAELEKKGVKIVADEVYDSKTADFRSILLKIKSSQPDAVFLDSQTPANLVRLAQQARTIGINAQFFAAEFNDPTVTEAGLATDGMIIAVAPGLSNEGKGKVLLDSYKVAYGKDATYPYYVGAAYDDLNIFAQGIAANGDDPIKVRDYLVGLKDYDGTIGKYSFDSNGDVVGINFVFQKVIGKRAVNIE